jgi:hypothetical protein
MTTTMGLSVQFPDPGRMGLHHPVAAWLALPSLCFELTENLQLREQDRLLEVRCSWQALNWRKHRCLLSARGESHRDR